MARALAAQRTRTEREVADRIAVAVVASDQCYVARLIDGAVDALERRDVHMSDAAHGGGQD